MSKAIVGHISELPELPTSELPEAPAAKPGLDLSKQDDARATALRIHTEHSLPFLEDLIKDTENSPRVRMDAVKLVQQQALPPPQPVMGDINVTIVVDM